MCSEIRNWTKNARDRWRPQPRWLRSRSTSNMLAVSDGDVRRTSPTLTCPPPTRRLSSARAVRTSLARSSARKGCDRPAMTHSFRPASKSTAAGATRARIPHRATRAASETRSQRPDSGSRDERRAQTLTHQAPRPESAGRQRDLDLLPGGGRRVPALLAQGHPVLVERLMPRGALEAPPRPYGPRSDRVRPNLSNYRST